MIDLESRDGSPIRLIIALMIITGSLVAIRWGSLPGTEINLMRTMALVGITVIAATEAIINVIAMRVSNDDTIGSTKWPDEGDTDSGDEQEAKSDQQQSSTSLDDLANEHQSPDTDKDIDVAAGDGSPPPSEFHSDDGEVSQTAETEVETVDDGGVSQTASKAHEPDSTTESAQGATDGQEVDDSTQTSDYEDQNSGRQTASVDTDESNRAIDPAPRGHEPDNTTDSTQAATDGQEVDDSTQTSDDENQDPGRQTVVADTNESDEGIDPAPRGHEPDWW